MEIKTLILFWSFLGLIGLMLMTLRRDVDKIKNEAHFIMTKGTFAHKITYVLIAFVILPLTILKSIQELLRK